MPESPTVTEWDQLVVKVGTLTIAAGYLEMAIIAMVCRILGKTEDEVSAGSKKKWLSNAEWCQLFLSVLPPSWSDAEKTDLSKRIKKIRKLYAQRSRLIHTALGRVSDGSISGVPSGGIVDLRTFGFGLTKRGGNTWTIGLVGKRVHLHEIDRLTGAIHKARVDLGPYMELIDKIRHPPKPFPVLELGKLVSRLG
jgi:hypothetical protein